MNSAITSSLKFKFPQVTSNALGNYTTVKKTDISKYTVDTDKFIKNIDVSDIYTSSGELDWTKIKKNISPKANEDEGKVFDKESNMFIEQYDLKTADIFDESIIRYSMLKSKILEKSNKTNSEYNLEKLDDLFEETVEKNATILGIQFSDFYSGDITGKVKVSTPENLSYFKTETFIENLTQTILQRKNDFAEIVEEKSENWESYMDYAAGKTNSLEFDFLNELKSQDTLTGAKSEINLNFTELNKVSKLMVSITNNFNNEWFESTDLSTSATELIAGVNIGIPLLKIDVVKKNFNISTASSTLLMLGVASITKNLITNIKSENKTEVDDSKIYMYGGYISDIMEKSGSSFRTNYKNAMDSIQSIFISKDSEYSSSKLFNKIGADWNKFLNLLEIPNKSTYSLDSSEENSLDIIS